MRTWIPRALRLLLLGGCLLLPGPLAARGHRGSYESGHHRRSGGGLHHDHSGIRSSHFHGHSSLYPHHRASTPSSVKRNSHGKIARSSTARERFMRMTGYPHGRPGYVIDHIIPLSKGGADDPSNMQWQTREEAKEKDRTELR